MRERSLVLDASRENDCTAIGGREGETSRSGRASENNGFFEILLAD